MLRRFAMSVALVAAVASMSAVAPMSALASTSCPSFSAGKYRFSGVRGYALPCSLGRAVVRAWARKRFYEYGAVSFSWHGGRASFDCFFYQVSNPDYPDGRCKGGVSRHGREYPFGTVDWKRRRAR